MSFGIRFNMVFLMLHFLSFINEAFRFKSIGNIQDVSKIHRFSVQDSSVQIILGLWTLCLRVIAYFAVEES